MLRPLSRAVYLGHGTDISRVTDNNDYASESYISVD